MLGRLSVQSSPVRVRSRASPWSMCAPMRKPSSFISCSHRGPDGGFSTGWESCGGMKRGREKPRRDGPDLPASEAERLTTRWREPELELGVCRPSTRVWHNKLLNEVGRLGAMIKTLVVAAALTVRLAGYAVAQQAPPAVPAHHLPPYHLLRRLPPHLRSATFRPTIRCGIFQRLPFRHRRRSNRPARASKSPATRFGLTPHRGPDDKQAKARRDESYSDVILWLAKDA
jgi:hypothetical protein